MRSQSQWISHGKVVLLMTESETLQPCKEEKKNRIILVSKRLKLFQSTSKISQLYKSDCIQNWFWIRQIVVFQSCWRSWWGVRHLAGRWKCYLGYFITLSFSFCRSFNLDIMRMIERCEKEDEWNHLCTNILEFDAYYCNGKGGVNDWSWSQ